MLAMRKSRAQVKAEEARRKGLFARLAADVARLAIAAVQEQKQALAPEQEQAQEQEQEQEQERGKRNSKSKTKGKRKSRSKSKSAIPGRGYALDLGKRARISK